MGRREKLLSKILRTFTGYALIVFAISVPTYYYLVDSIWLKELDEHNHIVAERTEKELNALNLPDDEFAKSLQLWNKIQPGTSIRVITKIQSNKDSSYVAQRRNTYAEYEDIDRFRGLLKTIRINGKPYELRIETNVEETEETVIAIAATTLLFVLLLIIGLLLLNSRLSITIWRPFQNTIAKLKAFNINNAKCIQFEKSDILEFEELNNTLSVLLEHSISLYKTQKEFTENASHELQTPLAIITNKLDLLLQHETLTERQYRIIEEINKVLTRISRINKNLLLLAKIENQQFADTHNIDMSIMIQQCLEHIREYCENADLHIIVHTENDIMIEANAILIEVLINNLFMNAIRYNQENGEIIISLSKNGLTVSNSGAAALNTEKLFKRFSSVSEKKSGSGLGLAIVKEVCNQHCWKMEYSFSDNHHHFSLLF